jgi:hypothetical protein
MNASLAALIFTVWPLYLRRKVSMPAVRLETEWTPCPVCTFHIKENLCCSWQSNPDISTMLLMAWSLYWMTFHIPVWSVNWDILEIANPGHFYGQGQDWFISSGIGVAGSQEIRGKATHSWNGFVRRQTNLRMGKLEISAKREMKEI